MRIDKDYNRGIIDDEQRSLLTSKALDLYHTSYTNPEISNDDFEKQLMSEKLYALCGVDRYTNKRGRPKGNKSKR